MKRSVFRLTARILALAAALLIAAAPALPTHAAAAAQGYSTHRLSIVTAPGKSSKYMDYYKSGKEQNIATMKWVEDATMGKVLQLSGANEYLQLSSEPLPLIRSTFAAWVNWEDNGNDPVLFALTSSITDDYITLSLHHSDTERKIDGVYFHLWRADGDMELEWFNPVSDGVNYAIPQNEWHHVAFTVDGQYFRLYIDGQLWFEKMVVLRLGELRPSRLYVGSTGNSSDSSTLKAKLADVCLYDEAMTAAQVGLLMQNRENPFDADSAKTTKATTLYQPSAPTTTTTIATAATTQPAGPIVIGGFPLWTLLLMGGIVLLFVVLSVALSVHRKGGGEG